MANRLNENYLNSLVTRIINETASERAEQIEGMLMGKETDEGNAFTAALAKTKKGGKFKIGGKTFTDTSDIDEGEMCEQCGAKDEVMEGEMCEQCGGPLTEGMCEQCSMNEGIYDVEDLDGDFDYVQEEEDMDTMDFEDDNNQGESEEFCKYQKEKFGEDDERYQEKCSHMRDLARKPISMNERLHGKQRKLDKNKNGRLDKKDFEMMRGENIEEGTKRKESIRMTESEMIDFIEKIVVEEKLKSMGKHKGTATYEKAHKGSGKENDDYIESVAKKMKDYLKDGSLGDYDTNPEIFPKGNGELGKMKKKAYVPSDSVKDYVDNLTAAGQENLDYDEIQPSEEWLDDNIEGSSKTGNNPEWANTGKSDINKKRNKIRKDNMLAKIKRKAYHKAPQPIVQDNTGEDSTGKLMMKLESTNEKESIKLNEEFDRMKQLLSYNKKTQ
jgi:hypothetical protein